jgi:hypothetical protein
MLKDTDKPLARELLLKSKTYRFFGNIFAVVGLIVFLGIYATAYSGDVQVALRDPLIVIFLIFPFIPAVVFSLRAKKAETALQKLLSGS